VLAAVRLIYPIAARWVWQRNWHHQHECGPACGSPAQQRCLQHSLRFLSTQWTHTHTHSLVSKAQTPAVRCGGVSWGFLGLFCWTHRQKTANL